MKVTKLYCDACGENEAETITFFTNRSMSPAGCMENEYKGIEICNECLRRKLHKVFARENTFSNTEQWYKFFQISSEKEVEWL